MFLPRRLGKLVRDSTTLSVREIRDAWQARRIIVDRAEDPALPTSLGSRVFEEDVIFLDGVPLRLRPRDFVAALHKPAGVTSTSREPTRRADLRPWLARMPDGTFPIGRLDRETSGLLLFATDGDLANALLRPGRGPAKHYRLRLRTGLRDSDPRLARMSTPSPDYDCASRAWLRPGTGGLEIDLVLHEGKNRQIRRLCHALGLRLSHLQRLAIGSVELGGLPLGEFRRLDAGEVETLWESAGGRARVEQAQVAALYREAADERARGEPNRRLERWLARFG